MHLHPSSHISENSSLTPEFRRMLLQQTPIIEAWRQGMYQDTSTGGSDNDSDDDYKPEEGSPEI